MKRIMLSVVVALGVFSSVAEAQMSVAPNMFPTLAACREALTTGRARFYEPRYFGLHTQNPPNGRDRIVVVLESDICIEMLVVGGRQFVAQPEGTAFRAQRMADGSLSLYARDDCGNPVFGVVYPPPPPQASRGSIELGPAPVRHEMQHPPEPPHIRPVMLPIAPEKKDGFCSSKKCRWTLAVIGASAAGYATWRLWPCPPGTVRR